MTPTSLTKAVLNGIKHREPVDLVHPSTGEPFQVIVRPLTDGEAALIKAIQSAGLNFETSPQEMAKGAMKVRGDLSKMQQQQAAAMRKAIALALCMEEKWSEEEIATHWPPGWAAQVGDVVYRITGMNEAPEAVRQFREVSGGDATADSGGVGDSPDADGTGPDTTPAAGTD